MFGMQTGGLSTTAKGDIAEQAGVLALMAMGKSVLRPVGNGLRDDLVVDNLDGSYQGANRRWASSNGAARCCGFELAAQLRSGRMGCRIWGRWMHSGCT